MYDAGGVNHETQSNVRRYYDLAAILTLDEFFDPTAWNPYGF